MTQTTITCLQQLQTTSTFDGDGVMYTGILDPVQKVNIKHTFDDIINRFITAVQNKESQASLLSLLKASLNEFARVELDTEDAEHLAMQFERIMDCIGLESSDGALNKWMYDFDV